MSNTRPRYRVTAFDTMQNHIGKDAPQDRTHIHSMKSVLAPLGVSMAALVNILENTDPTQTKAHNDRKIMTTAAKLDDRRKQTFNDLQKVYKDGLASIQSRIDAKISLKPDAHAAEIRATFRTMTHADRLA